MACTRARRSMLDPFAHSAHPSDVFVGRFASETRENFGTDTYGEYQIEVRMRDGKFLMSATRDGKPGGEIELTPCSADNEPYLNERPPGDAMALCDSNGDSVFSYSQHGIKVPVIGTVHNTQYYARLGWAIYGFRKIE